MVMATLLANMALARNNTFIKLSTRVATKSEKEKVLKTRHFPFHHLETDCKIKL
jgi:hypothetical protein